jgi:FKBP-type peptidyl-prolyl cis-trans isomerase SlyD
MHVGSGTVFSFHYLLKDAEGVELESTRNGEPHSVLYGRRQILPALETALAGKEAGETLTVTLPPDKAYGVRDDEARARVPIKHLQNRPARLQPGMMVQVNTREGIRNATVIKVGRFNVDVDTNHPYAGKTITFDVEVTDVRRATREEMAHGHAHGAGGHHH